jgi:hypothetical protein
MPAPGSGRLGQPRAFHGLAGQLQPPPGLEHRWGAAQGSQRIGMAWSLPSASGGKVDGLGRDPQARQRPHRPGDLPGVVAPGRRLPRRPDGCDTGRGPRTTGREAARDRSRRLAGSAARPINLRPLGRRVVGGVVNRPRPQPHHPGRNRKPPATPHPTLVRPTTPGDHPANADPPMAEPARQPARPREPDGLPLDPVPDPAAGRG